MYNLKKDDVIPSISELLLFPELLLYFLKNDPKIIFYSLFNGKNKFII